MTNPTDAFNHNVKGKDGVKPSWNPEGKWTTHGSHELYMGENGGRENGTVIVPLYVGNVLDYVENITTHELFQITALNLETLVPTLEPIVRVTKTLSTKDVLSAMGPGLGSSDHKITIDDTVFPYRLDVSPFIEIKSVEAHHAKIISGSTFGAHRIVGFLMTTTGELIDDNIPLDLIADVEGVVNYHIKNVRVCYTNEKFKNGDVLTVALYSSAGHLLSESQLVVVNSNFMRDSNAPRDYIKSVYIESPFLSPSNPFELEVPLGWNNSSINMIGIVEYQNGRKVPLPIDGRKFILEGLDQHLSSIAGHGYNLMLKYKLERGENTTHSLSGFSDHIPQPYRVRTINVNNSYTVKLAAFPVWDEITNSYRLRYFLTNLDRNQLLDVTSSVKPVAGSTPFNGYNFGSTQRLQVSLNLRDVFQTYKAYVHTQVMEVTLYGTPHDFTSPWTVKQSTMEPYPFGGNCYAKKVYEPLGLSLKADFTTKEAWLDAMFHRSYPLLSDSNNPGSHPTPTHFDVRIGSRSTQFPIDSWDKELVVIGALNNYASVDVIWKHKSVIEELVISVTSLIIQPS